MHAIDMTQVIRRAEEHLLLVTQERSVYKANWTRAQQAQAQFLLEGRFVPPHAMIAPASNDILAHYSFDFAQQVHYPSNPLQPGPIYFLPQGRPPSSGCAAKPSHAR